MCRSTFLARSRAIWLRPDKTTKRKSRRSAKRSVKRARSRIDAGFSSAKNLSWASYAVAASSMFSLTLPPRGHPAPGGRRNYVPESLLSGKTERLRLRQTQTLRGVVPSPSGSRVPSGRQGEGKPFAIPTPPHSPNAPAPPQLSSALYPPAPPPHPLRPTPTPPTPRSPAQLPPSIAPSTCR